MKLEDLLKGTPHEGKPLRTPPKANTRIEELEAAIVELAELIAGEEESDG